MYHALLAIQYAGIVILILELFFVFYQNPSKIQRDMIFLVLSTLVVFVAYTVEMHCTVMEESMVAVKFGYLGKPFIVFFMLQLILDYCRIRLPGWLAVILVLIQGSFSLAVFTAEKHWLFYTDISFTADGLFPSLIVGHGPLYLLYTVILFLYCIAMFVVCFRQLAVSRSEAEKRQIWLFIGIVFVPIASFAVYLTGVCQGYDCTLPGYLVSTIGLSVSFFGLKLFDTITLAREQVVDYIHCGLIVYDNDDKLIYHNELADRLDIVDKAAAFAKEGEPYFYQDRVYSVEDRKIEQGGLLYGHMFFIQDMTERYHYEKSLEEERRRADDASMAKTNFLSSMSHDIRTPINAILGMAKLAAIHVNDREKTADCLEKINTSGQYLLGVVNSILDMNKIESGKLEINIGVFDMQEFLEGILVMARPLAESRKHELITDFDKIVHTEVYGDKSRLSQVLMNLLSNAVKYTEQGGKIWFSAYEDTPAEETQAQTAIADGKPDARQEVNADKTEDINGEPGEERTGHAVYVFSVRDNGIGMSGEFLPYLFEPFTRAKDDNVNKAQGTGLGMAITKQLVSLMGGDISVESRLGEGSTFTVRIALELRAEEKTSLLAEDNLENLSGLDFSGKRILLAEDNDLNAEIAEEILGMTGIAVERAANGREAVEKVASCEDGYYDLIFMDIQMPVLNGYEAAREIRAMGRKYTKLVPIFAMTANAFAEDVNNAKEAGMDGHIGKPLNLAKLANTLIDWL